jgi:hypothetical protein
MSLVDPTVPTSPIALTRDMRRNFAIIKTELDALQAWRDSGVLQDSPAFSGTATLENADVSGTLTVDTISPTTENPVATETPSFLAVGAITAIGILGSGPVFTLTKDALGIVHMSGFTSFTTNALAAAVAIGPVGSVSPAFCPEQTVYFILSSGIDDAAWRLGIGADGSITIMKVVGAVPDTGTHSLYWHGSYKAA